MKNFLILFCLFSLTTINFIYSQQSFMGKWSAVNSVNEQFDFEFRSDGTCTMTTYTTMTTAETSWKVDKKDVILYKTGSSNTIRFKTISLTDSGWIFLTDDGIKFTCSKGVTPGSNQTLTCHCCYGRGKTDCRYCDTYGNIYEDVTVTTYDLNTGTTQYHTEKERRDCPYCTNGKYVCTCCKGKGKN